ncbi:MAG TPA: ABC transporter permease [Beutenbergiaceae bacterium]|nr:ABC transporter permease [Beutenbergiaceae bacterium]
MTTTTTARSTEFTTALRQIGALARMEATLLRRNKTALINTIVMAPVLVLLLLPVVDDGAVHAAFGTHLVTLMAAFGLIFVAYYNLTTTVVARREELTLKRLTSGELSPTSVLIGTATPAAAIITGQLILTIAAAAAAFELPLPANPVLVVLALVGGLAVFALLAYASSGMTKTVEAAQLTTLPVIFGTLLASGVTFPLQAMPGPLQQIAELTPLAPVIQLLQTGFLGVDQHGEALTFAQTFTAGLVPVLVLAGWCVLGTLATRRWMRWEPRR